MSYSFPRTHRLLSAQAFQTVFKQNFRSADQYFTVLVKHNDLPHARLGLAISRKALRFAHQRNLVKRLIRESFRQHQTALNGLDIIIMAKPNITQHPRALLHEALSTHWHNILKRCGTN